MTHATSLEIQDVIITIAICIGLLMFAWWLLFHKF